MGTSQDSVGNVNGGTTFYYMTDGSPFNAASALIYGVFDQDGMFGMWEYFNYAGYGDGNPLNSSFFTQPTDNLGYTYGFTFNDYMDEIDAGRVVMIHVEGHSMFGCGYNPEGNIVYLHDTWFEGQDSMSWGGSYSGLEMWGVTCFTPTGGSPVPIPGAVWLLGSGLIGIVGIRRRLKY